MGIGWKQTILYCLPKSVISTCIRDIVEDHCGVTASDLIQHYILYIQDWYNQALESAGLESNICDHEIHPDMEPSVLPIRSNHTKLDITTLLDTTAPRTALDTVWG